MFERFTDRARKVLQLAKQEAEHAGCEYVGVEHLLVGLLREGSGVAAHVLREAGIDLVEMHAEVLASRDRLPSPDRTWSGSLPQTPRYKLALQFACDEAKALNHNYVGSEHLLLGMLRDDENVASQFFMMKGFSLEAARGLLLKTLGQAPSDPAVPRFVWKGKRDFLDWTARENQPAEWEACKVVAFPPASRLHMETRRWFDGLLSMYVRQKQLGIVGDGMLLDLGEQQRLRLPDLFFVRAARAQVIEPDLLRSPPDLVLEVFSPESEPRDRQKYAEYRAFGVAEYWMVDPDSETMAAFALGEKGVYEVIEPEEHLIVRSQAVAGFWIKVPWLWAKTRPVEEAALAEIIAAGPSLR